MDTVEDRQLFEPNSSARSNGCKRLGPERVRLTIPRRTSVGLRHSVEMGYGDFPRPGRSVEPCHRRSSWRGSWHVRRRHCCSVKNPGYRRRAVGPVARPQDRSRRCWSCRRPLHGSERPAMTLLRIGEGRRGEQAGQDDREGQRQSTFIGVWPRCGHTVDLEVEVDLPVSGHVHQKTLCRPPIMVVMIRGT